MAKSVEFCQRDDGSAFAVVGLTGDVDLATVSSIRTSLRAAVTRALAAEVPLIIDCTTVTFLGLPGISALLEAKERYRQEGRLLLVGPPGGPVARMVTLLGLNDVFELYPTVADAL